MSSARSPATASTLREPPSLGAGERAELDGGASTKAARGRVFRHFELVLGTKESDGVSFEMEIEPRVHEEEEGWSVMVELEDTIAAAATVAMVGLLFLDPQWEQKWQMLNFWDNWKL